MLPHPRIAARLDAGNQHQATRSDHQRQHQLHRLGDAIDDALDLFDDGVDFDDGDGWKFRQQPIQEPLLLLRQEEAGHVSGGQVLERRRREDDEEVRLHALPFQPAQAGDLRLHRLAPDVETQPVADAKAEFLRILILQGHQRPIVVRAPPSPFGQFVVLGQRLGPSQVALRGQPRTRRIRRPMPILPSLGVLAVHGNHPSPNHRIEGPLPFRVAVEQRIHRRQLVWRDVHQEVVGHVIRQCRAPFVDQRRAQQHQHQQQHDGEAEDEYLGDVLPVAALQAGQGQAQHAARLHANGPSAAQQQPGQGAKGQQHRQGAQQRPQGQH